ncbi:plasmodesmata-located protein 7-like [Diospyros lotus]|uniref:plasmodesmata-located protein 7-like n=1 Tax=Diospyros lotus TaxID=55363 RepID=UPI0022561F2A|nr:plasmodesmata-located protein 7-like [Diospyros lotus]
MAVVALTRRSLSVFLLSISLLLYPSTSAIDSFIYVGCSQQRFNPNTPYESNVNSLLTSLVNSAASAAFNNFKISVPGSTPSDVVYGLFQCRGDLPGSECRACVARAVSQLGLLCPDATGAALQLDGCFVKYDNTPFLSVQDKSVLMKKCGPAAGYATDGSTSRDSVMEYLTAGGEYFRVGGSGSVHGEAQCVQDLSLGECNDCLSEAIGRLKSECGSAAWGDMFLGKCYARFSERGGYSGSVGGGDKRLLRLRRRWWSLWLVASGLVTLL